MTDTITIDVLDKGFAISAEPKTRAGNIDLGPLGGKPECWNALEVTPHLRQAVRSRCIAMNDQTETFADHVAHLKNAHMQHCHI